MSDPRHQLQKDTLQQTEPATPLQSIADGSDASESEAPILTGKNLPASGEVGASDSKQQFDHLGLLSADPNSTPDRATPEAAAAKLEGARETASILHNVLETAEQMRSDGRSNVELQLHLRDGQELTIRLRLQGGELQPVFKTESAELRAALEQNWSQFTSNSGDRGMRIAAPVFSGSQSGLGDSGYQQQDRQSQQQPQPGMMPRDEVQYFPQTKSRPAVVLPQPGADSAETERAGTLSLFA